MKQKFLYRTGSILLTGLLIFQLTACRSAPGNMPDTGSGKKLPTKTQPTAASEDASSVPKHSVSRKSDHSKNMPVDDSAAYDDSLIADAYSKTGQAQTDWDWEYSYTVRVPKLLSDTPDAQELNEELMEFYGAEAMSAPDPDIIKNSIDWESHWSGSLLSLEMIVDQPDGSPVHSIYYFDFASGTRLFTADVIKRMDLTWDILEPMFIRAAAQAHDHMMQEAKLESSASLFADAFSLRAQSLTAAQDAALPLYPNNDGTLSVYLNLATFAGSGWMQQLWTIDPNETATPLSARYEFITAAITADKTVTVTFEKDGEEFSGKDYQSIYGFELGKPYRIDGCFGQYKQLFIGNIGSHFEPYLFLLTKDNTLEYVDLFCCARYDTYVCGGPVYGISNVQRIWSGIEEKEDYSYATVYAQDGDKLKYDLLQTVYISNTLPFDLSDTFIHDEDDGSWQQFSLSETDGMEAQVSSGDNVEIYTGFPIQLGMNADGLVYGLNFWDDSGNDTCAICALSPGNGMLGMTQISGDNPFGLRKGQTLYLLQSYG